MNLKKHLSVAHQFTLVSVAGLLTLLTGCVGYVDRPAAGVAYEAPAAGQDDYIYYPNYGIYYSASRRQYAYLEGNAWVSQPAPRGVSVNVLLASPSVKMDFHDSPANHHAAVVKQYPKNWKPSGSNHAPNNHPDDRQADNGR